ncbi:MAG: serine hydrolase domain-containing protein, partial [Bacteroidota bacterium]
IPGLAAMVAKGDEILFEHFSGLSDVENNIPVDAQTIFPIASLTKIFSGILALQLVEEGKLDLDAPLKDYFPDQDILPTVQVKHVLSHTSQGDPGEQFYYSYRIGALTKVLESAAGTPLSDLVQEKILRPHSLTNTFPIKDSISVRDKKDRFALPYVLGVDGLEEGPVEWGYSTSAGLASTLKDLHQLSLALDEDRLISAASKKLLYEGLATKQPYGFGIFSQRFKDHDIYWAYGQYDGYSSLFIKVPQQDITLILLANNNLMSDPARLIYGDVFSSLFAHSFFNHYVFNLSADPIFAEGVLEKIAEHPNAELYRKRLQAQALAASFMARFDLDELSTSVKLLETIFAAYPNFTSYGDLNTMHNLVFLKDVAAYRNLGALENFDRQLLQIGNKLLEIDPNNPYANLYMASHYQKIDDEAMTRKYYKAIVEAENFAPFWYTAQAESWLEKYPE